MNFQLSIPQSNASRLTAPFRKGSLTRVFISVNTTVKGGETITEIARLITGLRAAGWSEEKINDFLLFIESGDEQFKPAQE